MSITLPTLPWGVHRDIAPGTYHAVKWAASASQLRVIHSSTPAHLFHALEHQEPPTPEMVFGELVHRRILEPSKPLPQVAVIPEMYALPEDSTLVKKGGAKAGDLVEWNTRAKYCREWVASMEAAGLIVMTKEKLAEIDRAAEAVMANSEARDLIAGAATEVTLYWQTSCGFPCKARLDLIPVGSVMADLKTCADASERGFQRHAWDMGYHLQAAFYLDAWDTCGDRLFREFKFIAYEKGVGLVRLHRCTDALIEAGRAAYSAALNTYMRCVRSGVWPGYPDEPAEFDVPAWARREA